MADAKSWKAITEEADQIAELIKQGKLPKEAMPRFFFQGHKVLYGVAPDKDAFKCVACGKQWEGNTEICGCENPEIFEITSNRIAKWECVQCKCQWIDENGTKCPKCGIVLTQ